MDKITLRYRTEYFFCHCDGVELFLKYLGIRPLNQESPDNNVRRTRGNYIKKVRGSDRWIVDGDFLLYDASRERRR